MPFAYVPSAFKRIVLSVGVASSGTEPNAPTSAALFLYYSNVPLKLMSVRDVLCLNASESMNSIVVGNVRLFNAKFA